MGYTHYFGGLQPDEYLARAAEELVNASNVSIKGWDGECEPRFQEDIIDFNGDYSLGEDFETFRITRGDYEFNFCKTGRRPYDEVVCAFLTYAIVNEAEGWENISSDGTYEEWAEAAAFDLYESVFGELSEEDLGKIQSLLR